MNEGKQILCDVEWCENAYQAMEGLTDLRS